ncbi:MAG: hypothetical protein ACNYPH_07245 [Gammaproteobacteria bacterium WSBS_2016_MAG_OTU1]
MIVSIVFIAGILTIFVFWVIFYVKLERESKHDCVVFAFARLQSAVTNDLIVRYEADTLTRQDFEAARFLSRMLDNIDLHYKHHKTTMFNLRKMRQRIEQDLECYEEIRKQVREQLPTDPKIAALYDDFNRAATNALLAYTPFIRTEIILRLLLGDIAGKITKIREEQKLSGEKFA